MRLTTILAACAVIALGFWAYQQTIQTQMAVSEVQDLELQISHSAERLSVLRAEWAYLNRPDRLMELARFNFDRLGLMALAPEQMGHIGQIPERGLHLEGATLTEGLLP